MKVFISWYKIADQAGIGYLDSDGTSWQRLQVFESINLRSCEFLKPPFGDLK